MKVTVSKYLNVRIGEPSVNARSVQYLAPGSVIEVDDQPVKGDTYDNVDTWYKDSANNFYWTGGFAPVPKALIDTPLLSATPSQLDWYHHEYNIVQIWNEFGTQGEGASVAVIDSGIKIDPYFSTANIVGINHINPSATHFNDIFHHGTKVASIIAANGPELIGIAPKCELFVAKVFDVGDPTPDRIADALLALPAEIKIVVIAHSFMEQDFVTTRPDRTNKDLRDIFVKSERILLCTPGNFRNHHLSEFRMFPAMLQSETIFSVAAVGKGKTIYIESPKASYNRIAAPGEQMKVISPFDKSPVVENGTSFAAPFVAGTLALMFSLIKKRKKDLSVSEVINILENSLQQKTIPQSPASKLFGKGIIDPLIALRTLNQKLQ